MFIPVVLARSLFLVAIAAPYFAFLDLFQNSLPRDTCLHHVGDRSVLFACMVKFQDSDIRFSTINAGMSTQISADACPIASNAVLLLPGGFQKVGIPMLEVKALLVYPLTVATMSVSLTGRLPTKVEFIERLDLFACDAATCLHE